MSLSVHELNRFMEAKRRDKYATFEKIHEQCHKLILKYASNDKYRCLFTVPDFILGLPLYKLNHAIMFVIDKLKARGFLVKYYHPNVLYICWDIDEIHGRIQTPLKPVNLQRDPPRLTFTKNNDPNPMFPPMPEQTRVTHKPDQGSSSLVMPHMPSYDLPMPQASYGGNGGQSKNSNFIKSISNYKPSGKFVIDV